MKTTTERLAARLDDFVDEIGAALGSQPQRKRFAQYALGLLLPGDRKSMEPMAARVDPDHAMARYKTFQRFISVSRWDDLAVRRAAFWWAEPALLGGQPPLAWVIDDTGFPKQGKESVFVQRQYSGTLGKVGNCQVAVSLSICTETQSFPLDFELYMPESWANDWGRRHQCKVPTDLRFRTKPRIALALIARAIRDGIPTGPIVSDSGYGDGRPFRQELDSLGAVFVLGVHAPTTVYRPAAVGGEEVVLSVLDLGVRVGRRALRRIKWRDGTKGKLASRFFAIRVSIPAESDVIGQLQPEQRWLLIEWPRREPKPTKFWFSNLAEETTIERLVLLAKNRAWIERDYEDLKGELGLDHFEGRSYGGWHHHVSVCIAAFAFLLTERGEAFFPSALASLAPPGDHRPRGHAIAA
jgi:SRSO17 transposase